MCAPALRFLLAASAALLLTVPARAIIDQDGDGWSDLWQMAYGTGYLPDADDDGDGRTNRQEHDEGTDPHDATSLRPTPSVTKSGKKALLFSWPTVVGKTYQLEASWDGTTWADLGGPVFGTGAVVEKLIEKAGTYLGTGPRLNRYTGLDGQSNFDDLKALVDARTAPTETALLPTFETAQTNPNLDQYGQQMRGWIIPPADGAYVFYVAGNMITELQLSTNAAPGKKQRIAFTENSTQFRQWNAFPSQKSVPVSLRGGRLYYIEAWQKETTGSDHLSLAWTGPGLNPDKEIIDGAYVTEDTEPFGRKLARLGTPTYRLTVSDRDADLDGLTDHEEMTVGLDPFNPRSVSQIADRTTLIAMLAATNTITVGAEALRGYEAEREPAKFTFFRAGNVNPVVVHFTVEGTAQAGQDFAPLPGTVTFGVGQTSATVEVLPEQDAQFEPAETVIARIAADAAYAIGTPSSATIRIDDAADVVYVATLRADGNKSGGYGTAAIRTAGNKEFGDVAVSFGNLSSAQTGTTFTVLNSVPVLTFPAGQISAQTWTFGAAGPFTRDQILAALDQGRLIARIATTQYPQGEISGAFIKNWGWRNPPKPPKPGPTVTRARTDGEAARFLTQATFGPTGEDIERVKKIGFPAWIEEQFGKPTTLHLPKYRTRRDELLTRSAGSDDGGSGVRQEVWWDAAIAAPDQLRQRLAFALSEIFVASEVGVLEGSHEGLASYYDLMVKHAFGNYRDLLEDVTLSPIMGQYLSMARNQKPNPDTGSQPDENYAREVQQLFSIGLNQLNLDGSLKLDARGLPLGTYTQDDIVGLAHVFTGWGSRFDPANPPSNRRDFYRYGEMDELNPMIQYFEFHDTKAKRLVGGVVVPANLTAEQDLKIALDTLYNHPSTAPFIARQLIQRFVTSNPSRGYIHRVASAFEGGKGSRRGDFKATIKAVLLDPEARQPVFAESDAYGKLKEPLLRASAMIRGFKPPPPLAPDKRYFVDLSGSISFQAPLKSPSVFNFFQPGYIPPGPMATAGLFGPEFQITSETSVISFSNTLHSIIQNGIGTRETDAGGASVRVRLNLDPYIALLERTEKTPEENQTDLIDSFDALLCGGKMSPGLAQSIRDAFAALPANFGTTTDRQRDRVRLALYVVTASPEFSIQK